MYSWASVHQETARHNECYCSRQELLELKVIGLTGAKGGELATVSDVAIKVPETETYMIQELHLPVYHCLCLMLEDRFFGE